MGISASQARLLTLTSRLRDIEYKQQQLANTKMRFSVEQDEVSAKYSKALDKQKIQFKDYNTGEYSDCTKKPSAQFPHLSMNQYNTPSMAHNKYASKVSLPNYTIKNAPKGHGGSERIRLVQRISLFEML